MALTGIPGASPLAIRPNPYTSTSDALRSRTDVARPDTASRPASLGSLGSLGSAALAQPASASLPAEAPAGTDPELWSVLSSDERAFFAKAGALGPLTYGRATMASATAPATARGGRLDVRA